MDPLAQAGLAFVALLFLLLMGARSSRAYGRAKQLASGSAALALLLVLDLMMSRLPVYSGLGHTAQATLALGAAGLWIGSAVCPGYWRRWPDIAMVAIPVLFGTIVWMVA